MIYRYENEETKEVVEREFSMHGDIPAKVEVDGKEYLRMWGSTFHIPFQWGQETGINFKKSPSGKKHFY